MSKLDNALHQSIVNRSPTLSVEGQFLFIFLWAGFFSTLAGVIIIYLRCDRSRTVVVKEVSNLFKRYMKQKDKITQLEDELQKVMDRYT